MGCRCVGVRAQQHASHVDAAILRVAQEDECLHPALDDVACRLALSVDGDVRGADSDRGLVTHAQRFDRIASEHPCGVSTCITFPSWEVIVPSKRLVVPMNSAVNREFGSS